MLWVNTPSEHEHLATCSWLLNKRILSGSSQFQPGLWTKYKKTVIKHCIHIFWERKVGLRLTMKARDRKRRLKQQRWRANIPWLATAIRSGNSHWSCCDLLECMYVVCIMCAYVCMYECMYAYECMYVCIWMYVYVNICISLRRTHSRRTLN